MPQITFDVPTDTALGELAPYIAQHFGEVASAVEQLEDGTRVRIDVPPQVGMVENTQSGELKLTFGEPDHRILSRFVFDGHSGELLPERCNFNMSVEIDRSDELRGEAW